MVDKTNNTVDLNSVQAIYAKHFNKIKTAHEEIKKHAAGHPTMAKINLGSLTGEFCKDYPILKNTVKSIEQWAWLIPTVSSYLAIMDTALEIVDSVQAKVCPA